MPDDKTFIDTNVLVYAYDRSAGVKRDIARQILSELWESGKGALSVQVLQEFFVTITKKVKRPLGLEEARETVADLLKWEIVANDGESILRAIAVHERHKLSFWDAMIIQAALKAGATTLLTEDLADGVMIDGLKITNPFAGARSPG
jgi:predicted nucleic acid-binding protein